MHKVSFITNSVNFLAKKTITSIPQYKECLEKFATEFEDEIALKTESPIFLDTNVLLRYYSISFTAREKLFKFIQANKGRIVITPQVQMEFLKNREDVIQRFFDQVTTKIPKEFNGDVVNKMKSFLELHKIVLKDYPFVEQGILEHQTQLEEILGKLNENVETKRKELTSLFLNDELLDLLSSCKLYHGLNPEEIDIVKKAFEVLSKSVGGESADSILNKPGLVFPGYGDIKAKPDDPSGDFILFHEMMKFMIEEKTNVIFLTFDNTKGDWMSKLKAPHLHYVQIMYANTGHSFFVVDAERTLGELLNVNIKSLVSTESQNDINSVITENGIKDMISKHECFAGAQLGNIDSFVVEELKANGYLNLREVEDSIKVASEGLLNYRRKYHRLNTLGLLRAALKIVNKTYHQYSHTNGTWMLYKETELAKHHAHNPGYFRVNGG